MLLDTHTAEQTLLTLKEQQARINKQISGLVAFIDAGKMQTVIKPKTKHAPYRNVDIRPAIVDFFIRRNQVPFQLKDVISEMLRVYPEMKEAHVRNKVLYFCSPRMNFLVKKQYGLYVVNIEMVNASSSFTPNKQTSQQMALA